MPTKASDVSFKERSWAEPPEAAGLADCADRALFELKAQKRGGFDTIGRRVEFHTIAAETGQRQRGRIGKSGGGQDRRKGEPVVTRLEQRDHTVAVVGDHQAV